MLFVAVPPPLPLFIIPGQRRRPVDQVHSCWFDHTQHVVLLLNFGSPLPRSFGLPPPFFFLLLPPTQGEASGAVHRRQHLARIPGVPPWCQWDFDGGAYRVFMYRYTRSCGDAAWDVCVRRIPPCAPKELLPLSHVPSYWSKFWNGVIPGTAVYIHADIEETGVRL